MPSPAAFSKRMLWPPTVKTTASASASTVAGAGLAALSIGSRRLRPSRWISTSGAPWPCVGASPSYAATVRTAWYRSVAVKIRP